MEVSIRSHSILGEKRTAIFSPCEKYRYVLQIIWDATLPVCQFIGLNPSTATEILDDPTIRRCKGFARAFGCGSISMTNAFAFRATDPKDMKMEVDPVGPLNNYFILSESQKSKLTIAAWGVHGTHHGRDQKVVELINNLVCLGKSKDGHPRHPLYLKADTQPIPFK